MSNTVSFAALFLADILEGHYLWPTAIDNKQIELN